MKEGGSGLMSTIGSIRSRRGADPLTCSQEVGESWGNLGTPEHVRARRPALVRRAPSDERPDVVVVHIQSRSSRPGCPACGTAARIKDRPAVELVAAGTPRLIVSPNGTSATRGQPARPRLLGHLRPWFARTSLSFWSSNLPGKAVYSPRLAATAAVLLGERPNNRRRSPPRRVRGLPSRAGGWRRGCPRRGTAGTTRGAAHDLRRTRGSSWSRARTEPGT